MHTCPGCRRGTTSSGAGRSAAASVFSSVSGVSGRLAAATAANWRTILATTAAATTTNCMMGILATQSCPLSIATNTLSIATISSSSMLSMRCRMNLTHTTHKPSHLPPDAQDGAPQLKPKLLRFVMDLSGSMYYFNNHDRRLERALQTAVMIFEAFSGFEHKYHYAMVGHSGDTPCAPLVAYGAPPEYVPASSRNARAGGYALVRGE